MNARRWIAIGVAAAQIALLAWMAGEREWIARTGRPIALRTAPIDPHDPMRGQYVRLDYDISVVPREHCRDGVVAWFDEEHAYRRARDRVVYAVLTVGADGLAEFDMLTDAKPTKGTFLRGRVDWMGDHAVGVRYGIEAFFMEQGKARALEDAMRNDRRGLPLNMKAAVGSSGVAVLRDYAWESLGITIELERTEPARDESGEVLRGRPVGLRALTVQLKNHGEKPVAIVDRPNAGSFRLVRNQRRWAWSVEPTYRWVGESATPAPARPEDVRVLAPGESHATRIDFSTPDWFVVPLAGGEPISLTTLPQAWNESYRIEYVPPDAATAATLPHAELIQLRPLRTRAFTPAGNVD